MHRGLSAARSSLYSLRVRRGLAMAVGITTVLTVIAAWPVVRSPRALIYGHEIVGRHHDAYTVMQQIGGDGTSGLYAQPVTDRLGWLFARAMDPVSAYNLLVLLSFPLTAAATYALARRLLESHAAALIAALAFTFAPMRLAHAAYHPHIVQTQWIVLYLLALFVLVDAPSWFNAAAAAVACGAMVLSNYYAALIGAVLTPIAIVAHWASRPRSVCSFRSLGIAAATTTGLAAIGVACIAIERSQMFARPASVAFDIHDIPRFSARWWAYLTPPVDHPFLGAWSAQVFARNGETLSLVEQQIFISYALLALAAIAVLTAIVRWRREPRWRPVLSMMAIGGAATFVSIGPLSGSCDGSWAPACLIYMVAPMFRAYARFAVVSQLAVAFAAGAGATILARQSRAGLTAASCLVAIAAVEYLPLPWRAHDVLPTAGHRWVATQPHADRLFDCAEGDAALASVPWLMKRTVSFLSREIPTCADPQIGIRLAGLRYTHMVVRLRPEASQPPETAADLALVAQFADSRVYAVASTPPSIVSSATAGFFEYEHRGDDWWRWMGPEGRWTVRNTTNDVRTVLLGMRLASAGEPRTLMLTLDDQPPRRLEVGTAVQESIVGPWTIGPGDHTLTLEATGAAVRPSDDGRSRDMRRLSVMFRSERWIEAGS